MDTLIVMAVAGIGTFALRSSMVVLGPRVRNGGWLDRRIALIGPAVLGAIVIGSVLVGPGGYQRPPIAELAALAGGLVAVRRTGNVAAALAVGFPLYWLAASIGLG